MKVLCIISLIKYPLKFQKWSDGEFMKIIYHVGSNSEKLFVHMFRKYRFFALSFVIICANISFLDNLFDSF